MATNSNSNLKRFCAVHFPTEDNIVALVPQLWLTKRSGTYTCKFPNSPDSYDDFDWLEEVTKKEERPDEDWSSYPVNLLYTSNNYSTAKRVMENFQFWDVDAPDDESEEIAPMIPSTSITPRALEAPIVNSSASEDVKISNCDNLENNYSTAKNKMEHFQFSDVDDPDTDDESEEIAPMIPSTSMTPRALEAPIVNSSASMIDVNISNCDDLEKKVATLEQEVESFKKTVMDLKLTITEINAKIEQQDTPQRLYFQQLKTTEELTAFIRSLNGDKVFSNMFSYFSAFGGTDASNATRRILSELMSNELAIKYNWQGSKGKISFKKYKKVIKLVADSVRHNFENFTVYSTEEEIKLWLRNTSDRINKAKTRKN